MDRRTFIFFISLSLTLFAVNFGFTYWDQQKNKEWVAQQKARQEKQQQHLLKDISERTAKAKDLPLTTLYSDPQGTNFLSEGIVLRDNILSTAWSNQVPKKIFAKKETGANYDEYQLSTPVLKKGDPITYTKGPSEPLLSLAIPQIGSYDVQLVSLNNKNEEPSVYLGEYRDGHIILPILKLAQLQPEEYSHLLPQDNLLVLIKKEQEYLPIGIYNSYDKTFIPLAHYEELVLSHTTSENQEPELPDDNEERFYVLENQYQQLVFSNKGGALVEINLPFQSTENKESVVKSINIDREMVEEQPQNARFPSQSYYTTDSAHQNPQLHKEGKLGGYYPLLRRNLIEKQSNKTVKVKPAFYALNIVSEYPELAELTYTVKHFDEKSITFEAAQPHRRITKTFSFEDQELQAPYIVALTVKVEGDSRGLWLTTGVPEAEGQSGSVASSLKYRITRQKKSEVENISLPEDVTTVSSINPDWICDSNGFFGIILDPLTNIDSGYKAVSVPGTLVPTRLVEIDQKYQRYKASDFPGYTMMFPLKSTAGAMRFRVFAGPFATDILKTVDSTFSDASTGYNPDYIACQSFHGWFAFISEPFAKFLFFLMTFFYRMTHSWGLSIILLTVALRLLLYPLNSWSMKSMSRMQQIAPELSAIQERYKKDPKKLQLEIANLYREKGINPFSGCLPLLIQMPFLIGMFDLLKSVFELRGAVFIPGWIDDLSAPDVLFRWSQPIFFIGNEFHLLPVILGLAMFLQQRLSSTLPKDPKMLTEQQKQQKVMGNMMTIVFTVMFYNMPSGLNIYWLFSILLGILQQWITNKQMKKQTVVLQSKPAKVK